MKVDSHSHSSFSHDGREPIEAFIAEAKRKNLAYYAVTEHLDRDYKYCRKERFLKQLNLRRYARAIEALREKYEGETPYVAFGVEAGYCAETVKWYEENLPRYDFDVIVNSIHTIHGGDAYFGKFFKGRDKDDVYLEYLGLLIDSVKVPYRYDIIGHIGYITRYAGYPDVSLWAPQYLDKIDELFEEIISRGKTVEINTHIRHPLMNYLPERPLLERYYALGGRNVTFSSDAHVAEDICKRYDEVAALVKEIGFTEWTVYKKGEPYKIPVD